MHRSLAAALLIALSACSGVEAGPAAEGVCGDLEVACGSACVDLTADAQHCGACGNRCADGTACIESTCRRSCPAGALLCGGVCIDPLVDAAHCGACGHGCDAGDNATATCELGTCIYSCSGNFRDCNGEIGDGCERDVSSDPNSCGACDAHCLGPPQAEGACVSGTCGLGACMDGFDNCDGFAGNGCETSLQTNAQHCGDCNAPCAAGSVCVRGTCEALRPNLLVCGVAQVDVATFIPPGVTLDVVSSCTPDDDTQAVLVTRSGTFSLVPAEVIAYVDAGGIVVTELGNGDDLFGMLFTTVTEGLFQGNCSDNIATVVQRSAADPTWIDRLFVPIDIAQSGCGRDLSHFPDIVPLAGWTTATVSLAYRNRGAGRLWLVEADWQDFSALQTQQTRELMGYMMLTR